jgi:hypothetical protein
MPRGTSFLGAGFRTGAAEEEGVALGATALAGSSVALGVALTLELALGSGRAVVAPVTAAVAGATAGASGTAAGRRAISTSPTTAAAMNAPTPAIHPHGTARFTGKMLSMATRISASEGGSSSSAMR